MKAQSYKQSLIEQGWTEEMISAHLHLSALRQYRSNDRFVLAGRKNAGEDYKLAEVNRDALCEYYGITVSQLNAGINTLIEIAEEDSNPD